jgi:hypothetical protein
MILADRRAALSNDRASIAWSPPCALDRSVPCCAGVYAYGKSEKRTQIVDGRARKNYGHRKPIEAWVFIKAHHEGYIGWAEFERNQAVLAGNAYGKIGECAQCARSRARDRRRP